MHLPVPRLRGARGSEAQARRPAAALLRERRSQRRQHVPGAEGAGGEARRGRVTGPAAGRARTAALIAPGACGSPAGSARRARRRRATSIARVASGSVTNRRSASAGAVRRSGPSTLTCHSPGIGVPRTSSTTSAPRSSSSRTVCATASVTPRPAATCASAAAMFGNVRERCGAIAWRARNAPVSVDGSLPAGPSSHGVPTSAAGETACDPASA